MAATSLIPIGQYSTKISVEQGSNDYLIDLELPAEGDRFLL
jgi:hypothetical protein